MKWAKGTSTWICIIILQQQQDMIFPHWITWQNVSLKMFLLPISTTKKGNVIVHSSNNNVCKYLVKNSCSAFPFNSNQLKKPIRYEWMKSKR